MPVPSAQASSARVVTPGAHSRSGDEPDRARAAAERSTRSVER